MWEIVPFTLLDDHAMKPAVGLVRLDVAENVRDRIKNDIILELAIAEVTSALYLFVDTPNRHTATKYISELFNVAWDLASVANKSALDIRILGSEEFGPDWNDLLHLPEVEIVYGEIPSISRETEWLKRDQDHPVRYCSPTPRLEASNYHRWSYFEDGDEGHLVHAVVVVNGTFDHLHNGHRKLLSLATSVCSERLIVGVTAVQALLDKQPFSHLIQPLETRKHHVQEFVKSINHTIQVEIVEVVDSLGPGAENADTRVLVVGSTSDFEHLNALRRYTAANSVGGQFVRLVRRTDRSTLSSRRIRERMALLNGS